MSRYKKTKTATNSEEMYVQSDIMENRGVKKIIQYRTFKFNKFTKEQWDDVPYEKYYWSNGDRFWKISNKFYGDPTMWWVIARWNFKPTESHLNEGDELRIPTDLRKALELIR